MPRAWVWLQLVLGWLPVWAWYATLIVASHPGTRFHDVAFTSLIAIGCAAALGVVVYRLARRLPWPHPLRPGFVAVHVVAAAAYAVAWVALSLLVEHLVLSGLHGRPVAATRVPLIRYLLMGGWLYLLVAGVTYATQAAERAARAEALAARSRLAALRSQLNPHFLFNALHTVVQLIPREPARAAQAAEQVAGLLRTTLEEDRDLVPLSEEWAFVERYLDVERIRFGDRLAVRVELSEQARGALVPSFALQTLVENAVRHGAAPRVEPTEITVAASVSRGALTLTVRDTGAGASAEQLGNGGTGLQRLRDRLVALYGDRAKLDLATGADGRFTASLIIPQSSAD